MVHAITARASTTVALRPVASHPSVIERRRCARLDDTLAPDSRVGSWIVTGELGRGGMASVHGVVHAKLGQRAAIKIAHRSVLGDAYTAHTFLREARVVHAIAHPGVIDVFGEGSTAGRPYLVMERLAGTPLGPRIERAPIERVEALEILIELCDILRAAHAAGIVHRDLKLDNVFVLDAPYAGGRRVKLIDWGVAHVDGEDDPFHGLIAGTLSYVAPEQIRGGALTPATDIYSLAVLAYQLLCHRPPFAAQSDLALIQMHLRTDPPRASHGWLGIPSALDTLLYDMMAKSPYDRPSLDEVEHVLRAAHDQLTETDMILFGVPGRPPIDVFGRPALPCPPFQPVWIGVALALAGVAGVISALP
jgi:serine/threonine-protein kinase